MAEYLAPGVYVEEFSGINPIDGVSTSTAGFIGMAKRGKVGGKPQLITSFSEYIRYFGEYLGEDYGTHRFLSYAVEQFFINGGSRCFVMRVANEEDKIATTTINEIFDISAKNPGDWGNNVSIKINISYDNEAKLSNSESINSKKIESEENLDERCTLGIDKLLHSIRFDMIVSNEEIEEVYEHCSLNENNPNYIESLIRSSALIDVRCRGNFDNEHIIEFLKSFSFDEVKDFKLIGGSSSLPNEDSYNLYIGDELKHKGLKSFENIDGVSIIAIPGITDTRIQQGLMRFCEEKQNCFTILDIPLDKQGINEIIAHRENFDSSYAAMYHPWIRIFDPLLKKENFIPPTGSIAGIYARTDNTRGIHKAPANEVVRGATGLSVTYKEAEQAKLNPKGINLIRALPGMGIRVWGARTCSSDGSWKYVNIRRLFIYIEESIKANTKWAIFEPNDEILWARVSGTIRVFLITLWRNGVLAGSSLDEAFFINIGKSTMTQDDILNGRLICVIGIATVRPAEFIIFRVEQKMNFEN